MFANRTRIHQVHFAALDNSVNARFFEINPARAMAEINLKEWPLVERPNF